MLEQLLIFSRGGLILWAYKEPGNALKGSPIDALIRSVLLEERSGADSYNYDAPGASYTLKWTFHNELGLVFVAVYHRILHLLYVDYLLSIVKQEFSEIYDPKKTSYNEFDDILQQLKMEAQAGAEEIKKSNQVRKPVNSGRKQNGSEDADVGSKKKTRDQGGDTKNNHFGKGDVPTKVSVNGKENCTSNIGAFDVKKLQKLRSKGVKKTENVVNMGPKEVPKKKLTKKNRVWDDAPPEAKLDFTDPVTENTEQNISVVAVNQGEIMMDKEEIINSKSDTEDEKKKGWVSSMFHSIAGKAILEKPDLDPAFEVLRYRLVEKNVAREVADKICESVAASLDGKKLASFTRISSTVQAAMEDAIVRILTPRRSIDILRDVHAAKEQGKPYVVVFVGVNGVGKTTNLAKVAYWLLQHEVNVMMATCDTFRSGAVEQLRVHAHRLQIPLFEKGYEKDPAMVAKEAIQEASRNGSDVVLVVTAGRLQDNEPLMRALSKLIYSQKLGDLSPSPDPRLIDGTLLTKFEVDNVKRTRSHRSPRAMQVVVVN